VSSGVSHVVLDEVHERNLESDLLLLLLRRALLLGHTHNSSSSSRPPKVLLMSATADAQLFGDYFAKAGPEAVLTASSSSSRPAPLRVSLLSIPGFTHPVRQMWLEDALQQTGVVIGKQSRCEGCGVEKGQASRTEPS
jgi:ATP-dependent RNA helicase DHX57